ncbi:MAG: ABC transporter ATP-binding protein [Leucobacter sp.]
MSVRTASDSTGLKHHDLNAAKLSVSYGDQPVLHSVDLRVRPGKITAIVGANGCGKSTLLHALSRLIKAEHGVVTLDGQPIKQLPSKQLARELGLLPQGPTAPEGITVADLVGRGRYPHQGVFATWSHHDYEAVANALNAAGITDLADRSVDELSGGQRQRVWIAMALAQETEILLLDEPTTFLDISHQVEVLDLLTDLNRTRGTTIVMVLHDLNLAARYADELVAMRAGEIVQSGSPQHVVTESMVREVFGLTARVIDDPTSSTPLVIPIGRHHDSNSAD